MKINIYSQKYETKAAIFDSYFTPRSKLNLVFPLHCECPPSPVWFSVSRSIGDHQTVFRSCKDGNRTDDALVPSC